MLRELVKIDEELCDGCGDCVPECHEGALQIIDGKARLVSDLMCDGLGACLGHCPQGALTIEKQEAEAYNETKVMEIMVEKGANTVIAHLKHLKDHQEFNFLKEGVKFLKQKQGNINFDINQVISTVHNHGKPQEPKENVQPMAHANHGGCPGSQERTFAPKDAAIDSSQMVSAQSELRQWPVQMHLVNPMAPYFRNADVVLAADCVAFAMGNFHQDYLKGRGLAIACPKLDQGQEVYMQKLVGMIDEARINTLTVMIMQVPCCSGLLQMAKMAMDQAERKVPLKAIVVSLEGDVLSEEWI